MITEKNPVGIIRFDHLEYTTKNPHDLKRLFHAFGFKVTEEERTATRHSLVMSAGTMWFVLSNSTDINNYNFKYLEKHGGGVSAIAFEVVDIDHAIKEAVSRGAIQLEEITIFQKENSIWKRTAVQGFGDVRNIFIQRQEFTSFAPGYVSVSDPEALNDTNNPNLVHLDHLTNNVPNGEMEKWVSFYQKTYGFDVVRYFEIKGEKTALRSKVVRSENKWVCIPINEPWDANGSDQITEYIIRHNGPGVQHIAMSCKDILTTVKKLKANGFEFLTPPPHSYYEMLPNRVKGIVENIPALEDEAILVDGDDTGYLLQIFTKDQIGPVFFEIIERKGHDGFGDGNFQALFDAIERDQMIRGVLK